MIPIPQGLLEQFERGNVLLFIGERITRDAEGRSIIDNLTTQLKLRCDLDDDVELAFPEAAQLYEDENGRQALVQFILDQLEAQGDAPQIAHHLVAELSDCTVLATTCLDRRLERAFEEVGRPLDIVIGNIDVAFEDERKTRLYKLRGSIDRVDSLVLTEDDYEAFFDDQSSISIVLQGYLARKTILFVGYDLADSHFKRLYSKVTVPLDHYARRAYAFGETPPPKISRWCKRHGIEVVETDATAFLEALTTQLAARSRPAEAVSETSPTKPPSRPLVERPYKFLDYYEPEDASIFFGRQQETRKLSSLIHAHRLVLLYGSSGTGKTSLLMAGVMAQLEQADTPYDTLYVRALEDPAVVIRRALRQRMPEADLPLEGSLVDFLAAATRASGRTLVIILDQFEEFFIRLSPEFRTAFITELGILYDTRDLPIKVVLSLREDWLAAVGEIEQRIPSVFRTRMRLLPLTQEQARQAITAPVEHLGVSYQPALVDQLLVDLTGEGVMPPQLQLVCSALYEARSKSQLLTVEMYNELGQARGVLQAYLAEELQALGRDQVLAHGLLEELITSQHTKAVRTVTDLARALQLDEKTVAPLLERMVAHRLLRPVEQVDQDRAYELAHEYLIREIGLSPEAQARKQAQEIIAQELDNYQRFGTLLPPDKLALVDDVRAVLHPSPEAQELLLRSALQHNVDIPYWLTRVEDPTQRQSILAEMTKSQRALLRRRAAMALGVLDEAVSVNPLIALAVEDQNPEVRATARGSLMALEKQQAVVIERLVDKASLPERHTAVHALEALSALPLKDLSTALQARVLWTRLRLQANAARQWVSRTPTRRSLALTVGLFVVLFVVIYVFAASRYYVSVGRTTTDGSRPIVIRRGFPGLPFPGLGKVVIDTGLYSDYFTSDGEALVLGQQIQGFWWQKKTAGDPRWIQDLVDAMAPYPMARTYWYLGQTDHTFDLILQWLDSNIWYDAADILPDLLLAHPDLAKPHILAKSQNMLDNPNVDIRVMAVGNLEAVAGSKDLAPKVVEILMATLAEDDIEVRYRIIKALEQIVNSNPSVVTMPMVETLIEMLEYNVGILGYSDWEISSTAMRVLEQIGTMNIDAAVKVIDVLEDRDWHTLGYSSTVNTAKQIGLANPELLPQVITMLIARIGDEPVNLSPSEVDQALSEIAVSNSEFASQIVEALLPIPEFTPFNRPGWYGRIDAIKQIIECQPEISAPLLETAVPMLSVEDWVTRRSGITLLTTTADLYEDVTPQVITLLIPLLNDDEAGVRIAAASSLAQLTGDDLDTMSAQIAEILSSALESDDSYVYTNALATIDQVVNSNPDTVTAPMIEALAEALNDSYVSSVAAEALVQIAGANPEMETAVLEVLEGALVIDDWHVRLRAAEALVQIMSTNHEATTVVIEVLKGALATDDGYVRSRAATTLGQVAITNPEMSTVVVETLVETLVDDNLEVRSSAVKALGQIWVGNLEIDAEQIEDALVGMLMDDSWYVRSSTARVLGEIYSRRPLLSEELDLLVAKLTDPLDVPARNQAARVLFLRALYDSDSTQEVHIYLEELSAKHEPISQMWANMTLEMINLADLAQTAVAEPLQHKVVVYKLTELRTTWFFGEDLRWAAQEASNWLVLQTVE